MRPLRYALATAGALAILMAAPAGAAIITFTGGTASFDDGSTGTTSNDVSLYNVLHYDEAGFRVSNTGGTLMVGTYYGVNQDVMHTHWARNGSGVTEIKVARLNGAAFDLNAFSLTSNNQTGGTATGDERVFIHASEDGVHASYSMLLPSEDWGSSATTVTLGTQFDRIKAFWFTAENFVDCFGMDNVMIEEPAGQIPEPASLGLIGIALAAFAARRRRR